MEKMRLVKFHLPHSQYGRKISHLYFRVIKIMHKCLFTLFGEMLNSEFANCSWKYFFTSKLKNSRHIKVPPNYFFERRALYYFNGYELKNLIAFNFFQLLKKNILTGTLKIRFILILVGDA